MPSDGSAGIESCEQTAMMSDASPTSGPRASGAQALEFGAVRMSGFCRRRLSVVPMRWQTVLRRPR
jgi:hypothetical protein